MNRDRLLESLYRFREFLIGAGNGKIDLWPLANALKFIESTPGPATAAPPSDLIRECAELLNIGGYDELADALLASQVTAPPAADSVKVRIAVRVTAGGLWWECEGDADVETNETPSCFEFSEPGDTLVWVTVHIPIPQIPTVPGTVEAIDDPEATV